MTRFGVDVIPVLRYQVLDARPRRRFLPGFGGEDYVTIQRDVAALQQQHRHHAGGHLPLVVERPAAVHIAAIARGAERGKSPFGRVHLYGVGVAHQQNGALGSVALQARDEIRTRWVLGGDDDGDSFGFEDLPDVLDGLGFVAGRIGSVDADQRLVVAQQFRVDLGRVDGLRRSLRLGDDCAES